MCVSNKPVSHLALLPLVPFFPPPRGTFVTERRIVLESGQEKRWVNVADARPANVLEWSAAPNLGRPLGQFSHIAPSTLQLTKARCSLKLGNLGAWLYLLWKRRGGQNENETITWQALPFPALRTMDRENIFWRKFDLQLISLFPFR